MSIDRPDSVFKEFQMVKDNQVRIIMKLVNRKKTLKTAAARVGQGRPVWL
jgi:hypothetical protein